MEGVYEPIGVSGGRLREVVVAELNGVVDQGGFSCCIYYLKAAVML